MISLGTLDSNGCTYKAKCGVMRISSGVLVVMKWQKINYFYVLQSTCAFVTYAIWAYDQEKDTTFEQTRFAWWTKKWELDFYVFGKLCMVKFSTTIHKTKGNFDYIH